MHPKPFPPKHPKLQRLPERKAVTIVAGFKCQDGVVLCADTQETINHISKRNIPKLRVEPSSSEVASRIFHKQPDIAVAFCGATDNGPFLDEIIERAWQSVRNASSLSEATVFIDHSIKNSYEEFGRIYQPGCLPTTEIIYGIKMDGDSRLFYSLGPAVNEKSEYATGGVGLYMADFLATRMYRSEWNIFQGAILAAYILFETKEHVDGCGGESHIAILPNNGECRLARPKSVEAITRMLRTVDIVTSRLWVESADLGTQSEQFKKNIEAVVSTLMDAREQYSEDVMRKDFLESLLRPDAEMDFLGFLPTSKPAKQL
jgi:hypothetical protein